MFSFSKIRRIYTGPFLKVGTVALLLNGGMVACLSNHSQPMPEHREIGQSSGPLADQTKKDPRFMSKEKIDSYTLKNGMEVFLIEKSAIPMATVLIAVKNGSFAETSDNNGLAHLYEHMFFKANEKIPSQPKFFKALDELGVELGPNMNAYTSTESVRYFFTLQSSYLSQGLGFMADALITPKFLQSELEKERKVVIGEFDRFEASPNDVFFQRSLMSRLFKQNFVRKNVIGSRPVILSASQSQMHEIQHRYYIPNNSALFIVGQFDREQVKKDIERYFAKWEAGPDPFQKYPVPEHPALEKTEKFFEKAAVQTAHIVVAFQGPSLGKNNDELIALDLAQSMTHLEGSFFQKELVHSGLATSASFFSWSQRYTSPIVFAVETTPDKAEAAYHKLAELILRMKKGGAFTEAELKTAKTSTEVSTVYDRESGQKYALSLASVWTSTGNLDFYLKYIEEMKSISLSKIDDAFQKYFSRPAVIGVLLPQSAPDFKFQSPDSLERP